MEDTSTGLAENVAGMLCYLLGWITGILFLLIESDSKFAPGAVSYDLSCRYSIPSPPARTRSTAL